MKSETISVIIPVYNVKKYVEECINSVINQTYNDLRIILIDDSSDDGSGEVCDIFAKSDERIIVHHCKQRGGVSNARNIGLQYVTDGFISFIDADDYIYPDMYEKMIFAIQKRNADAAFCGYKKINLNYS